MSDRNRKIQDRAYEIWVEGGRQDGTSDHNWAQAEREIGSHDPAPHASEPGEAPRKSGGKAKADGAGAKPRGESKPKEEAKPKGVKAEVKPAKIKPPKDKAPKEKASKTMPDKDKKAPKASKSAGPKSRPKA